MLLQMALQYFILFMDEYYSSIHTYICIFLYILDIYIYMYIDIYLPVHIMDLPSQPSIPRNKFLVP